jgi:Ser/Thr protein kinase RdoA (MazF antagonist)
MPGGRDDVDAEQLGQLLREQAGLDLVQLASASGGESRCAFWVTDRAGRVSLLKIIPGAGPEAAGRLRALDVVLSRLRARGYPAPALCGIGSVSGLVFWIQERLPGHVLDRGTGGLARAAVAAVLPRLLELNDAQRGLGTGPDIWPGLIARTLARGGDGYCLHATLQASRAARDMVPVLRRIGDRCCPAIPAGTDFVHYDFTPANLLSDGTVTTGVIDINPPVLAGDRAFDLATLLFYCYDHDQARTTLTARLLEVAGPQAASAYLAHMILRQVDWSLRHHPADPATRRLLHLARLIIAGIPHPHTAS